MNRIQIPIFELKNILISYGDKTALKIGNFKFHRGTVYGIAGPLGSGKSTFLNMLRGKLDLDDGELLYESNPFKKNWRGKIKLPEEILYAKGADVSSGGTVNQFFTSRFQDRSKQIKKQYYSNNNIANEWEASIASLSAGQLRRLILVTAIESDPKVLIIDDYGINFDDSTLREFNKKLSHTARARGVTIILSSSRVKDISGAVSVLLSLDNGHLAKVRSFKKPEQHSSRR